MNDRRKGLSHNLTREWVTDHLASLRRVHATVTSEWIGEGVAFPQTVGEHNDPVDTLPPDWVHVYVVVPASMSESEIKQMMHYLHEQAEQDPRFGGRFASAHMEQCDSKDVERVDSADYGPDAKRLTLRFSVQEPDAAALMVEDEAEVDSQRSK